MIAGYHMDVDPAALGFPVTAYVRIRPAPGQLPKVGELAQRTPEVVECHRITGEDCFLLKVHVPKVEYLVSGCPDDQFGLNAKPRTALGRYGRDVVCARPPARRGPVERPRARWSRSTAGGRQT